MGTRSCIGYKTPKGWRGIYVHFDGYPTGVGKEVWDFLKRNGVEGFIAFLKSHQSGFSSFPEKCYCHNYDNGGSNLKMVISSRRPNPLFMEWLYIVDRETKELTVYTNVVVGVKGKVRLRERYLKDGVWDYGHCVAKHFKVVSLSLSSDEEPNWEEIERLGDEKYEIEKKRLIKFAESLGFEVDLD